MKTKIYGASDDLIEIEGQINEEASHYNAKNLKISCSDGTVATINYGGNWNIIILRQGSLFDKLVLGNPNEDPHSDIDAKNCSAYSDVLILKEGIEWVKIVKIKFNK